MKNKVIIHIEKGRYSQSHKNGAEYISVGFNASNYGAGYPCDNKKEVERAIKHSQERIIKEGDIPFISDDRTIQKTLF